MGRMLSRWWAPGVVILAAAAVLAGSRGVVGIVLAVVMLLYAWALSPAFFPRSTDLDLARELAATGGAPLIFVKPGCMYCIRLRVGLGAHARRASWVDSSVDERAEEVVRSSNNGDHTTPTVLAGDETRTNPDLDWVRSVLR